MIADRQSLMNAIDRLAEGAVFQHDVELLRGAVERLDEMDDLVDAVCSCRTQEIPILRGVNLSHACRGGRAPGLPGACCAYGDDYAPGRP